MDIQNVAATGQLPAQPDIIAAPPTAQTDRGAAAEIAASATNPRPDMPLPIPATPLQTGLVSKAAISEKETAPASDTTGTSAVQRTLQPYGITMLPEKHDAPTQQDPAQP